MAPNGARFPVWESGTFPRRLPTRRPCKVSDRLDLADALDIIVILLYFTYVILFGTVYILIVYTIPSDWTVILYNCFHLTDATCPLGSYLSTPYSVAVF